MESWRRVWRSGMSPQFSVEGLLSLKKALEEDDKRLIQGATTTPPPLMCVQNWPVEAGCLTAFCGIEDLGGFAPTPNWEGDCCTVGAAEEFFARCCYECDQRLGEPAGCRWLLNWWDETPRDEARKLMLEEVNRSLSERQVCDGLDYDG